MEWQNFARVIVTAFAGIAATGGVLWGVVKVPVIGQVLVVLGLVGMFLAIVWGLAMFRRDLWLEAERRHNDDIFDRRTERQDTRTWFGRRFDAFGRRVTPRWR